MFTVIQTEEEMLQEKTATKQAQLNKIKKIARELQSIDEDMEKMTENPENLLDQIS